MSTIAAESHDHGPGDAHGHDDHAHGHGDPHLAHHFQTLDQQYSASKLGMWTFLATEVLMFGGLFVLYSIFRANHPQVYMYAHSALVPLWGAINTGVLLASSFTMAWAVRAAQLNQRQLMLILLGITFMGGVVFMGIKAIEYTQKIQNKLWVGQWNAFNKEPATGISPEEAAKNKIHAAGYINHHTFEHAGRELEGDHEEGAATPTPGSESAPNANRTPPAGEGTPVNPTPAHSESASATTVPSEAASEIQTLPAWMMPVLPATDTAPDNSKHTVLDSKLIPGTAGVPGGTHTNVQNPLLTFDRLEPFDQSRILQFFSIYYMMTGLHGIHVLVGMALIAWIWFRGLRSEFSSTYFTPVDLVGLYWHLVDLIWIFLFPLLYLIH